MHPNMSKQYIARHDKAVRTVIQAFTRGQCESHYLIADVGKIEDFKDINVHSKTVAAFVLPDRCLQATSLDSTVERGFLPGGAADTQSKMRPDMMIVILTTVEQQRYLHHDGNSGSRLTPLTPVMPNVVKGYGRCCHGNHRAHMRIPDSTPYGNPRSMKIVEGGYGTETRYEEKLQEKQAQHKALEEALKDHGYNVNYRTIWVTVSHYIRRSSKFGIEHGPAGKVMSNLHEHSILTFHKILTSRR